jgi:formate dehydrogenase subunit gamma
VKTAPSERPAASDRLARFDLAERALHWTNAALFGVLLVTAAILYVGQLSAAVGRRELVRQVHVVCGLLLPVPLVLALAGPWRRGVLADLRAFNRWSADDRRWLRSRGRDPAVRLGKFNPGQKLNAAFVGGSIGVMLATGSVMHWFGYFPRPWRTGATFVHDWTALAVAAAVTGHIYMALGDWDALGGMVRGSVPAGWARHHRPRWFEQVTGRPAEPPDGSVPDEESPRVRRSG